jgi:hypothetical protein
VLPTHATAERPARRLRRPGALDIGVALLSALALVRDRDVGEHDRLGTEAGVGGGAAGTGRGTAASPAGRITQSAPLTLRTTASPTCAVVVHAQIEVRRRVVALDAPERLGEVHPQRLPEGVLLKEHMQVVRLCHLCGEHGRSRGRSKHAAAGPAAPANESARSYVYPGTRGPPRDHLEVRVHDHMPRFAGLRDGARRARRPSRPNRPRSV